MGIIQDAAVRLALELVARAITKESVDAVKSWVVRQAETAVGRTETEFDDKLLDLLKSALTPELGKIAETAILTLAMDVANATPTTIDDKIVQAIAKAEGVKVA